MSTKPVTHLSFPHLLGIYPDPNKESSISPYYIYHHLKLILAKATEDGDTTSAIKAIELMSKISGLLDKSKTKSSKKIEISKLSDEEIQDMIDQLQ